MSRTLSLILLLCALIVGLLTGSEAILPATEPGVGLPVAVLIAGLLACGVYGWYRIVRQAHEHQSFERNVSLAHRSSAPEPLQKARF